VTLTHAAKLPKGWVACKGSGPDYNECMKKSVNAAIISLKEGKKSLGVFPMDPFHFDRIVLDQGTGPVNINLEFTDTDLSGVANLDISSIETDWKKGHMKLLGNFPDAISVVGNYVIKGQILVLPISGTGKSNITLVNPDGVLTLEGTRIVKDKQEYFNVTDLQIDIIPRRVYYQFENLFNGDKALGDNMNKFLNENWNEVFSGIKDAIKRAFGAAFKEVATRIFSKIPMTEFELD